MLTLLLFGAVGSMRGNVTGCTAYTLNYPCVYVVNSAGSPGSVSVISSATNKVIVPSVGVGFTPLGAAITPDNRWLYVVNNDDATVSIVDTTSNTLTTTVPVGSVLPLPTQVAIMPPDGTAAYVIGLAEVPAVAVIDTATQELTPTIITGVNDPMAIAFNPVSGVAYVSDYCSTTGTACVDVLDAANRTVGTQIPIWGTVQPTSSSIAVTSDGNLICVSVNMGENHLGIALISARDNTFLATVGLGAISTSSDSGIAITPSGILYAAVPGLNSVGVVDTNARTLIKTIPVGNTNASSPTGVAVTPDGAQVYVSNAGESSVSVIDTQTQMVTTTIPIQSGNALLAGVAVMPTIVPTVQAQPASQTVGSGQTATLSVQASGTPPLSYQWLTGPMSTPIPGANGSSYTTPPLTATTSYAVVVSNPAGSIQSDTATVAVVPASVPAITTQPVSQNINSGQTAALTVGAAGSPPLSFQWYQGQSGATAAPVGTNSSSFTTPPLLATTAYWVRVTDSTGASVDSNTAIVAVNQAPTCSLSFEGAGSNQSPFDNDQFEVIGKASCNNLQGNLLTTTLDWGDGSPPSTQQGSSLAESHLYRSSARSYPLTVASNDSLGLEGSAFGTLILIPTSRQPPAVFQGQSTELAVSLTGPQGLAATFGCTTVTDAGGKVEKASLLGIQCSSVSPTITFTGAPQTVTIGIQTTGPASSRLSPAVRPHSRLYAFWFASPWMVLPLVILRAGASRRPRSFRRARARLAALSAAVGLLASCGGGFSQPGRAQATPTGSYQVTIVDQPVGPDPGFVQTSLIVPLTVAPFQ